MFLALVVEGWQEGVRRPDPDLLIHQLV